MPRSFWATTPFWIAYLLPPVVVIGVYNRGWFVLAPLVVVFVLLPLVDAASGVAPMSRESPDIAFNSWFRVVTWCWVPVQWALTVWLLRTVPGRHLSPAEIVAATVSVGTVSGVVGMTFAHELIHRRHGPERSLGIALLASVTYPHFAIEHVHGHHRHVATPLDAATARRGESAYAFLPRTIVGGLRSAWRLERARLASRGLRTWSVRNVLLGYGVMQAAIYAGVALAFGPMGVAVFAGQSAVAVVILEVINYVEHYGLQRPVDATAPSGYRPVGPEDSWDSGSRLSNWLLINLPRHSDHHLTAGKRYQSLELVPYAPHLPHGYGVMFLVALVPGLWFRIMNPRVDAVRLDRHL